MSVTTVEAEFIPVRRVPVDQGLSFLRSCVLKG